MMYTIGDEVEWLTRPVGRGGGYLHGIVMQINPKRVKIKIVSPQTGRELIKWVQPDCLLKVELRDREEA